MPGQERTRIRLEAENDGNRVRLCRTKVQWAGEEPLEKAAADLKGPINPVPLLAFLAYYKFSDPQEIHGNQYEKTGGRGSFVEQIHTLIDNCRKRESFWLRTVFGETRGECRVNELIEAPERKGQFIARLSTSELAPEDVALIWNGAAVTTESGLRSFLTALGISS